MRDWMLSLRLRFLGPDVVEAGPFPWVRVVFFILLLACARGPLAVPLFVPFLAYESSLLIDRVAFTVTYRNGPWPFSRLPLDRSLWAPARIIVHGLFLVFCIGASVYFAEEFVHPAKGIVDWATPYDIGSYTHHAERLIGSVWALVLGYNSLFYGRYAWWTGPLGTKTIRIGEGRVFRRGARGSVDLVWDGGSTQIFRDGKGKEELVQELNDFLQTRGEAGKRTLAEIAAEGR